MYSNREAVSWLAQGDRREPWEAVARLIKPLRGALAWELPLPQNQGVPQGLGIFSGPGSQGSPGSPWALEDAPKGLFGES